MAIQKLAALGLTLPEFPTPLEYKLMAQLLLITESAERVLSDIDDDGIAEATDLAVFGMRAALIGKRLRSRVQMNNLGQRKRDTEQRSMVAMTP